MLDDWSGMDIKKAIDYIRGSMVSQLFHLVSVIKRPAALSLSVFSRRVQSSTADLFLLNVLSNTQIYLLDCKTVF